MKKLLFVALLAGLIAVVGCGPQVNPKDGRVSSTTPPTDPSAEDGGEWCNPHGILEEECSMCSKDAAKRFKAAGDWCDKHNRAKSQCFVCDPDLMEKAKADYNARYGKEMPTPKGNMPEKK